jgi:hypothetical protein
VIGRGPADAGQRLNKSMVLADAGESLQQTCRTRICEANSPGASGRPSSGLKSVAQARLQHSGPYWWAFAVFGVVTAVAASAGLAALRGGVWGGVS